MGELRMETAAEICEYYDLHPDLLLRDLSRMTGRSIKELKYILMAEQLPEDNFAISLLFED